MEKSGSDGEVWVRLHVACILLVSIQPPCSRPDKNGVTLNPDIGIQAMVACKNCVWLVNLV